MLPISILHVETNLGLRPGGVERLGRQLLELGLGPRLGANFAGTLQAPPFKETRDVDYGARNVPSVADLCAVAGQPTR